MNGCADAQNKITTHCKYLVLNYTALQIPTLLIFIGKLKPTIGMIAYRNNCALDFIGKTAYKLL